MCSYSGCPRPAKWAPEILAWPRGVLQTHDTAASCRLSLRACDKHKAYLNLRDALTDQIWTNLQMVALKEGRVLDRSTAKLAWEEAEIAEVITGIDP